MIRKILLIPEGRLFQVHFDKKNVFLGTHSRVEFFFKKRSSIVMTKQRCIFRGGDLRSRHCPPTRLFGNPSQNPFISHFLAPVGNWNSWYKGQLWNDAIECCPAPYLKWKKKYVQWPPWSKNHQKKLFSLLPLALRHPRYLDRGGCS